ESERDHHGPAIAPELRILRQGPAAISDRRAHLLLRMHLLCRLRGDKTRQRLPELRRRLCATPDPPRSGMARRCVHGKTSAIGQARASEVQSRRHRRALGAPEKRGAAESIEPPPTLRAKRSNPAFFVAARKLDCFVACAPRNDGGVATMQTNRRPLAARLALFPRLGLADLPTPLEPMQRLTAHLGGPRLWVKREDATGLGF